jgi:nitric oxide reductase large subunit
MFFLVLLAVIGAGTTGVALENLDDEEVFERKLHPFFAEQQQDCARLYFIMSLTVLLTYVQIMMTQDGTYAVDPKALRE